MASPRFNIPKSTKSFKTSTALDIAARFFVNKLYNETGGRLGEQRLLRKMGETLETVLRAAERGWVALHGVGTKLQQRTAALTEEKRKLGSEGPVRGSRSG